MGALRSANSELAQHAHDVPPPLRGSAGRPMAPRARGQPETGLCAPIRYLTTLSFGGPFCGPGESSSPPSLPGGGSPSESVKIMPSPDSRA